jgi:ABC-type glycerol-3-phosphate transport system substrate-binding protein
MKNLFKFGFLALALSLSVVACSSEEKTGDSTDTVGADTTITADTTVTDTVVTTDTTVVN